MLYRFCNLLKEIKLITILFMFTSIHLALILHHFTLYKYEQNAFLPVRLIWFCFCQLLSCSHVFFVCSKVGWCIKTCKVTLFYTETGEFTKEKKAQLFFLFNFTTEWSTLKKEVFKKMRLFCWSLLLLCFSYIFVHLL